MGGACSKHRRDDTLKNAVVENVKGGDHLEDLRIDGNIILKWIY
jgi:hypothetical protein